MKFFIILLCFCILFESITSLSLKKQEDLTKSSETATPGGTTTTPPSTTETKPDATTSPTTASSTSTASVDTLINKIYEYAAEMAKTKEDPEKRKLKRGIVADYYPKIQKELLKKNALQQKNQGYLLKYLTEPYRFCIFPYTESNSMTYCDNTFKRVSTSRASECRQLMCVNCCDHLLYILKNAASLSTVSDILGLSGEAGFSKMKGFITADVIDQCRSTCDKEYPVEKPLIIPTPPKDPLLGKSKENAAKSCMDIKVNGIEPKDGTYYLKSGKKPAFKVYCDMTTDGGGWTLFVSYIHHPYEDYDLDGTKMPSDPVSSKSHFNLKEAGFDSYDVTELRFYCISNHGPKFMHFKSHNAELIETAMLGDQTYMKTNSWTKDKQNLNVPKDNKYFNLNRDKLPDSISQVGKNKNGGFWDSPFNSGDGGWTIKGDVKSGGRWECGDTLDTVSGSKYETMHQVWFRGIPPSKEFLQARLLQKATQ